MSREALRKHFERLQGSFPFCMKEVWRLCPDHLPEPHRVQYDMADWLQNGPKRRILRGFRGVSKTWETCAYICQAYLIDANERVLLLSQSQKPSTASLHMIRRWMVHLPFMRYLKPRPGKESGQRDNVDTLDVGPSTDNRVASLIALGITGQLPSTRATLVVVDDGETPENTMTHEQRQRLWTRFEEIEHIALPDADIVILGTPHNEESVYDELVKRGYACRSWPVAYPEPDNPVAHLSPMLQHDLDCGRASPGDPIWPERFDRDFILGKKLAAPATFEMQWMLRTGVSQEQYRLKLADLIVFACHRDKAPHSIAWGQRTSLGSTRLEDIPAVGFGTDGFYAPVMVDSDWGDYHGTKAFIDPAGAGKDEMAWAIVGQLHGYLYVKHANGVTGGASQENLEKIVLSLREYGCSELYVETNFGGDMLIQLLDPIIRRYMLKSGDSDAYPQGWACSTEGVHSSKMKEQRIMDGLSPVMAQHRLVVDPQVARDTILMYQLTRLTRQRGCLDHDDRIDALSGAVSQFETYLAQDAEIIAKRKREDHLRAVIAKHRARTHRVEEPVWAKY